jgi:hypothetical protein
MNTDQEELQDLRFHWGGAYLIHQIGPHWIAQRRDTHSSFSADGPDALLARIRHDYAAAPVPRLPRRLREAGQAQPHLEIAPEPGADEAS